LKKILIVDDEFLIRYSLAHVLQSASVDVTTVSTGTDALAEISGLAFDLCCLDIHLPDATGIEIMKQIREISPRTAVIMMTGDEVSGDMLADINKHSRLLLPKPFDLFKVKAFVDRLLAEGAAEAEAEQGSRGLEYCLGNDQRRHVRIPSSGDTAAMVFRERESERTAQIIDMSDGGICLMTTYYLQRGIVLQICNNKTGRCTGTVRWSMRTGDSDLFRTGIEFTPADDAPPH
jgi:DNA-binding response OmpR family regulator